MLNRRYFLKQSALLGAAATLTPASALWSKPANPDSIPPTHKKGDTYTVNMGHIQVTSSTARQIIIPDVEGFKVLKGDFHIHTLFSDGQVMPKDRVLEAVNNGLDAISITDHIEYRPNISKDGRWKLAAEQADDFNIWYETARSEAEKRELLLIRGAEITKRTMPPGHLNVLFASDNNSITSVVDDWKTMVQVAADQGAFLLWNHPGWEAPASGGIEKGAPLFFPETHEEIVHKGLLHGIEIFNYNEYYPVVSDWCNEYNLAVFDNSDIHESEVATYGIQNSLRPITLVLAKERSLESIKEAFFARRTIGWAAGMIWGREPWLPALFKSSVEIKPVTSGTLELINKSSLPVSVTLGGAVFELSQNAKRQVYHAEGVKSLTVVNWMTGMNKPLEIQLPV
jgi:predicted metal-dependent phosphoesterase TrpH